MAAPRRLEAREQAELDRLREEVAALRDEVSRLRRDWAAIVDQFIFKTWDGKYGVYSQMDCMRDKWHRGSYDTREAAERALRGMMGLGETT